MKIQRLSLVAGALVALCQPLAAAPVLEEVVVTAQKRSESINDVPITITAISGDQLQALGITDTRDLGKVTPGFTFSKSGVGTPVYTLRGVGFNDQSFLPRRRSAFTSMKRRCRFLS